METPDPAVDGRDSFATASYALDGRGSFSVDRDVGNEDSFMLLKRFQFYGEHLNSAHGVVQKNSFQALFSLQSQMQQCDEFTDICADSQESTCYTVLSPTLFWNNSIESFHKDTHIEKTVGMRRQLSLDEFPYKVSRDSLFGKISQEHSLTVSASSLTLSYLFNVTSRQQEEAIEHWAIKVQLMDTGIVTSSRKLAQNHWYKNGKTYARSPYVAVAAFTRGVLTMRDLIEDAERIDIFVVIGAYLLMMFTFVFLFANMRNIGSKCSLGITTMLCGTLALASSLVVVSIMGTQISLLQLSEGIPFLVITVGFDKPYILARAILSAHELSVDPSRQTRSESTIPLSVRRKVLLGIDAAGPTLLKHYIVEIMIVVSGAITGIPALSQFCTVAAWILLFDCLYMFTVFVATLTLKMELKRIRESDSENTKEPFNIRKLRVDEFTRSSWMAKAKIALIAVSVLYYISNNIYVNHKNLFESQDVISSSDSRASFADADSIVRNIAFSVDWPQLLKVDSAVSFHINEYVT